MKIKKPIVYTLYGLALAFLFAVLYYVDFSTKTEEANEDYLYVSRLFGDTSVPVVSTNTQIIRPYTDDNVKVLQNFYNVNGTEEEQENSITNYEQTYIQNSGTIYGGVDGGFDVISVLDGTVTSVKEDSLLGTIVEIKNSEKINTIYQSLSNINVKEKDSVKQGDIIGKSGENNLNKDLNEHLTFKIKIDGTYVNPEEYYNKDTNEI